MKTKRMTIVTVTLVVGIITRKGSVQQKAKKTRTKPKTKHRDGS